MMQCMQLTYGSMGMVIVVGSLYGRYPKPVGTQRGVGESRKKNVREGRLLVHAKLSRVRTQVELNGIIQIHQST